MPRDHGTERMAGTWSIDLPDAGSTWGASISEARWSDDGSRILVSRWVDPRAWPLLDAARPDIGALLVVFGVVAILIGVARIQRRPRQAGRSYCRRCNHDLNAPPGERPDAPRCPECGVALDGRGIASGMARGTRLRRVAVPALAAIACGAGLFFTSISRSRSVPWPCPAWPVPAASAVNNWPWWRRSTIQQPERPVLRVDVVRVAHGGLGLERPVILPTTGAWVARADGSVLAWTEHSEATGWVPRVAWFDTGSGRGGSADLGPAHEGFPTVCGWSPDGREIVALLQVTGSAYRTRDDGTAILDIAIMAVDTETGAVRTAGHGRGRATGGRTNWTSGPAIAALGTEPGVRAVTLAAEQESRSARSASGGIALRELTVMGDSGVRVIPLAGELFEQSWGFRRAWITGDGRLGVEFNALSINAQAGRPERFIDLATGAVTSEPSVAAANQPTVPGVEWLSPDGARLARITTELSDSGTVTRIGVEVTPVARSRPTTDERQPRRRRPPRAPATASSAAAPGAGTGLAR